MGNEVALHVVLRRLLSELVLKIQLIHCHTFYQFKILLFEKRSSDSTLRIFDLREDCFGSTTIVQ